MEQENDGFVSAADFFRQQPGPAAKPPTAADEPPRRPVRESLLLVARNSQVKNKISAFDKQHAGGPALPGLAGMRPAGGAAKPGPPARRPGAAPALGAIAEEAHAPPARRHAAVVSTAFAAAPPRRHSAAVQTAPAAQPPAVALPSPATKQQVAEKRHAAHFPSIMFQAPQPDAPARLPLAGGVAVLPPLPVQQQAQAQPTPPQLRPLPAVLAPARASLSPQPEPAAPPQQALPAAPPQQALLPQAVAKVLAAEAAAAAAAAESDDERDYVDAASGGPSQEGSAVFLDARDSHLVIHDDDAASVASDASTVVPDHHSADEEQQLGGMAAEEGTAVQPQLEQWGQQAEQAAAPAELPESQPAALSPAVPMAAAEEQLAPVPVPALSSGFAQLEPFRPEPAGLDAPFAAVPMRRSSLSPAPSAGQRRSSLGVALQLLQPQQEAESAPLRVSLSGGIAELAATQQAAIEVQEEPLAHAPELAAVEQPLHAPAPPAAEQPSPPSAEPSAPAAAPTAESSGAGAPLQPEASRLSLSSSMSGAPSLRIEFSEASLRYSVELGLAHSPRSHRSNPSLERLPAVPASPAAPPAPEAELLPPAAAATPQQPRLSLAAAGSPVAPANTPASPALLAQMAAVAHSSQEPRSQPVPASAVAQAIEAAAAESSGTDEAGLIRRLSLAEPAAQPDQPAAEEPQPEAEQLACEQPVRRTSFFSVPQVAEAAAAESPAEASAPAAPAEAQAAPPPSVLAAVAAAASPVPPTPYAATEYDGDDVVMMDVDFTPCPTTGRRPRAGSSRFQLEALASAARPAAPAAVQPSAPSPAPVPAAEQQAVQPQERPAAAEGEPLLQAALAETAPAAAAEPEQQLAEPQPAEAAVAPEPEEAPAQPVEVGRRTSLPELPEQDAAARRGRNARLSMPAARMAPAAEQGSRASRLSLPGSMRFAAVSSEDAFAARPKLAMSPAASACSSGRAATPEQQDEEQVQQQQAQQAGQQQQEQRADGAEQAVTVDEALVEQAASPVVARSRLAAEDEELPEELLAPQAAPSPAAAAAPEAATDRAQERAEEAAAAEPEAPWQAADVQQLPAAEDAAPLQPAEQQEPLAQQQAGDAEALAAAAFAAKPKLALSPAVSAGAAQGRASFGSAADADATAFAARPKLALSPAVSSGSYGRIPAEPSPAAAAAPLPSPAAVVAAEPAAQQTAEQAAAASEELAQQAWAVRAQQQHHDSPTMSDNPLALAGGSSGDTPAAAGTRRRLSHSPALSGLSVGALSNNPMFAGTPSHPTPPSVNLKAFTSRLSTGTPHSGAASAGSAGTPASTGIKLAEKLHQVAEQLQNPAAPQGLAVLATPGGARAATAAATPGMGRFEFADDVAGIMQALDARTPASALGQPGGLSRVAAALATTVQRPGGGRAPRYSFASGADQGLLDLEGYDANGERSGQAGPTPLLRSQLLAATPATGTAAASRLSLGGGQGSTSAATPAEVLALREEVAALRKQLGEANSQREEMVGLLGGYQRSIQELQDNHSKALVRLQSENTSLKAEAEQLRQAHADTDSQFRTLYNDKYLPLKEQAGELRREVAALHKRVVAEELKAHKATSDVAAVRQELAAAQERAGQHQAMAAQAAAEAAAARDAEQRLQQQLAGEQRRSDKAVAAAQAELADLKAKYGGLTRQYDEAVHKINLAKQARERAQAEVQRKEEEVVALEVRLKEYADALKEYKRENSKFFEVKERYKGAIAALEKDLQAKELEKKQLLDMCNELMTRLEREGLSTS